MRNKKCIDSRAMNTENSSTDKAESPTQQLLCRLKDKGLSQVEIVRLSGISQSRISRWERGEVNESADDIFKLQQIERDIDTAAAEKSAKKG